MSIETTIYSTLTGYSGLSALIGTRVFPAPAPISAILPLVTYQVINSSPVMNLGGRETTANTVMQFDCWAQTYSSAKAVNVQLMNALDALNIGQYSSADDFDTDVKLYRIFTNVSIWL